jgi:hypothetical protein
MDTGEGKIPDFYRQKLVSRLVSMGSVFNIAYNIQEMNNISFHDVLKEYAQKSAKNIQVIFECGDFHRPVEYQVTLLLVIDVCLFVMLKEPENEGCSIEVKDHNVIHIRTVQDCRFDAPDSVEEIGFALILAESIEASVSVPSPEGREIVIHL